jgi:hypothetical protein
VLYKFKKMEVYVAEVALGTINKWYDIKNSVLYLNSEMYSGADWLMKIMLNQYLLTIAQ